MRLPGAFRRLPRPSSALKPSHSPDGVICRAVGGVYWRLVNTFSYFFVCVAVVCAWCHSESALFAVRFTLHSVFLRAWSCMFLMAVRMLPNCLRSWFAKYKCIVGWYKG